MSADSDPILKKGRLSIREDIHRTVLLNGRPVHRHFSVPSTVFPIGSHNERDQSLIMKRLLRLKGWTPILVDSDRVDLSGPVVSAWVEERDGRVVWSRYAMGRKGEGPPVEAAPLAFDRDEYLRFVRQAADLSTAARLGRHLGPRTPRAAAPAAPGLNLAEELEKQGPAVAFHLLSDCIYHASVDNRMWRRNGFVLKMVAAGTAVMLSGYFLQWLLFPATILNITGVNRWPGATDVLWRGLLTVAVLCLLIGRRFLNENGDCPPVFMTRDGFEVGWGRKLIPWKALNGYMPPPKRKPSSPPPKRILTVSIGGRVDYKVKFQGRSERPNPNISALNATLLALIRKKSLPSPEFHEKITDIS